LPCVADVSLSTEFICHVDIIVLCGNVYCRTRYAAGESGCNDITFDRDVGLVANDTTVGARRLYERCFCVPCVFHFMFEIILRCAQAWHTSLPSSSSEVSPFSSVSRWRRWRIFISRHMTTISRHPSDSKVRYITSLKRGDMGIRGNDTLEILPEDTL
jgi:hypothetical protein